MGEGAPRLASVLWLVGHKAPPEDANQERQERQERVLRKEQRKLAGQ